MAEKGIPILESSNLDTSPQLPGIRPHVTGYLRIICSRRADGASYLSRKAFKSPIHISKPYWDGHSLLLNLMCPTAGLLGRDSVKLETTVESGASLTLSNPSSLRIHKMDSSEEATWEQSYHIASDGFLESNPEWLILQGASALTQTTTLELDQGAELFFIESIAAGRVAHGESFEFRRFRNRLRLSYAGKLSFLEKHDVQSAQTSSLGWRNPLSAPQPFYVSVILVSPRLEVDQDFPKRLHDSFPPDVIAGCSRLNHGPAWNLKLLADNPVAARKALHKARQLFYQQVGRVPSNLRR